MWLNLTTKAGKNDRFDVVPNKDPKLAAEIFEEAGLVLLPNAVGALECQELLKACRKEDGLWSPGLLRPSILVDFLFLLFLVLCNNDVQDPIHRDFILGCFCFFLFISSSAMVQTLTSLGCSDETSSLGLRAFRSERCCKRIPCGVAIVEEGAIR